MITNWRLYVATAKKPPVLFFLSVKITDSLARNRTVRYTIKWQWTHMTVFSWNSNGSLRRTIWEPNFPKPTLCNEFHRKQHIRVHDFQLAQHMTPDGTRNLYVCEFIRLICEMLKSENTFKETALSKAVVTWNHYTTRFRGQKHFVVYFVAVITKREHRIRIKTWTFIVEYPKLWTICDFVTDKALWNK